MVREGEVSRIGMVLHLFSHPFLRKMMNGWMKDNEKRAMGWDGLTWNVPSSEVLCRCRLSQSFGFISCHPSSLPIYLSSVFLSLLPSFHPFMHRLNRQTPGRCRERKKNHEFHHSVFPCRQDRRRSEPRSWLEPKKKKGSDNSLSHFFLSLQWLRIPPVSQAGEIFRKIYSQEITKGLWPQVVERSSGFDISLLLLLLFWPSASCFISFFPPRDHFFPSLPPEFLLHPPCTDKDVMNERRHACMRGRMDLPEDNEDLIGAFPCPYSWQSDKFREKGQVEEYKVMEEREIRTVCHSCPSFPQPLFFSNPSRGR